MPHRVAIFCTSFQDDFLRLRQLLASCARFCGDTPVILSVPSSEVAALRLSVDLDRQVKVIADEEYARPWEAGTYGWFQQQVCKLSVHRTGLADAYVCVDSDAYFLAPLVDADVFDAGRKRIVYSSLFTKYTADNGVLRRYLVDAGMACPHPPEPGTLEGFGERLAAMRGWIAATADAAPIERGPWINRLFGMAPGICLQPGQIFHASLLRRMEAFFRDHGVGLGELIRLVPWEFNWYGSWAAAAAAAEVSRSVSPIVHFASAADVSAAKAAGITVDHLRHRFRVVQMAARHFDALSF